MADMYATDAAYGFMPYGNILRAQMYAIVTANAVQMCIGDLVEAVGQSVVTPKHGSLQKVITEETGGAGDIVGGVLALFDSDFDPVYRIPVTTTGNSVIAGYALVADHPDQVFHAQQDGDTTSIYDADIGLMAEAVSTSTPAANNNYLSTMEIDSNTIAGTATFALHIIGVHPEDTIGTASTAGNYARLLCTINSHYHGRAHTGA